MYTHTDFLFLFILYCISTLLSEIILFLPKKIPFSISFSVSSAGEKLCQVFVWNCLVHLHFWKLSLSAFHSTISFLLLFLLRSQLPEVPLKIKLVFCFVLFFDSLLILRSLYVIVCSNFNIMHLSAIFFVFILLEVHNPLSYPTSLLCSFFAGG